MQNIKEIGDYIRKLREKANISLNSFAYKNGIEPSTLSRIENGHLEPKYSMLQKISKGLGLSLVEFIEGFEGS